MLINLLMPLSLAYLLFGLVSQCFCQEPSDLVNDEKLVNQKFVDEYYHRVEEEIKQAQKRLERLQEILKQRGTVERVTSDEFLDEQPPEARAAARFANIRESLGSTDDVINLNFRNMPWKEVFQTVVPSGITFHASSYPKGNVSFANYWNLTASEVLSVLRARLRMEGYDIWKAKTHWELVPLLDEQHPLLGTWKVVTLLQDGRADAENKVDRMTFTQNRFSLRELGDDNSEEFSFAAGNSTCYWASDDEGIIGKGSFQVSNNRATLLLAVNPDLNDENNVESLLVIRLERF